MNICVLQGTVAGEPRVAELPSGQWAVSFDVRTDAASASVPVEWTGPEKALPRIGPDTAIAVTGTLDRRFYRAAGSIQTRVFLRPSRIVLRQPKRQSTLLRDALETALLTMD